MPAYRDEKHGTFYASFYYTDFTGARRKKMKRGFKLKRDAQEWERQFLLQRNADPDMKFGDFVEIYRNDKRERIREHTWESKDNMINTKILPYFKDRTLSEIEPRDVIAWQNTLMSIRQKNGKPYSPTYLKSIHSQLSAIFNYAVKYYRLKQNPAEIAGNMGKETHREMLFWTKEEYLKFADAMMDKPMSYYAFEMLYWCGIREGELLALTPADFNFEKGTVTINKSYQRINKRTTLSEREFRNAIWLVRALKPLKVIAIIKVAKTAEFSRTVSRAPSLTAPSRLWKNGRKRMHRHALRWQSFGAFLRLCFAQQTPRWSAHGFP